MQDRAPCHHDCGYETAPFLFQELPTIGSPKSDFTVPQNYGIEALRSRENAFTSWWFCASRRFLSVSLSSFVISFLYLQGIMHTNCN